MKQRHDVSGHAYRISRSGRSISHDGGAISHPASLAENIEQFVRRASMSTLKGLREAIED
jgi:hypothetical protein